MAKTLDELSIILLRVQENTVDEITVVLKDGHPRHSVTLLTPAGHGEVVNAIRVSSEGEAVKNDSKLRIDMVLVVPSRADPGK